MSCQDTVLCSRAILSRNIQGFPFFARMSAQERMLCRGLVDGAMNGAGLEAYGPAQPVSGMPARELCRLAEEGLISYQLTGGEAQGAVYLHRDGRRCVSCGDEDHLRIVSTARGYLPEQTVREAREAGDALGRSLPYAFDGQFGYLSQSLVNSGTGLHVAVLMHLPGTVRSGKVNQLITSLKTLRIGLRGFRSEKTAGTGELFLLVNQTAIGDDERTITDRLMLAVERTAANERQYREAMLEKRDLRRDDRLMRSYGLMLHARLLNESEFLQRWSDLRLAVLAGLISCPLTKLDALLTAAQDGHLRSGLAEGIPADTVNAVRAHLVRETLRGGVS